MDSLLHGVVWLFWFLNITARQHNIAFASVKLIRHMVLIPLIKFKIVFDKNPKINVGDTILKFFNWYQSRFPYFVRVLHISWFASNCCVCFVLIKVSLSTMSFYEISEVLINYAEEEDLSNIQTLFTLNSKLAKKTNFI